MSSISWTSTTSGNWNTGSNWSGGSPPTATDDVTINTSTTITVTYSSGSAAVLSLATGGNDTLLITGGKLAIDGNATMNGLVNELGGTFTLAGAHYAMNGGLSQSAGTVRIASGTLTLANSSTIGGTISGAALNLSAGNDSIAASAALSVAELELTGADVTLSTNLSETGIFAMTSGVLSAGTNNVSLTGQASLLGGIVTGSGSLTLGGATEMNANVFEGDLKISNTGTVDQTGYSYIGYNGTDVVTFTNAHGALWRLDGDTTLYGNASTAIANAGTFAKVLGVGTSAINDDFTNTGTVSIATGTMRFSGAANNFGGVVSGAGTLELNGGSDTFASGLTLSVANLLLDGASTTLGANLTYGGAFLATTGTMSLGANTFTLTGTAALDGGTVAGSGKLLLQGATQFDSGAIVGAVAASNSGTITQTNNFYIGYYGTDTVNFTNAAAGLYRLEGGNTIYSDAGSSFANAGTFEKTSAGLSYVNIAFSNTGTVAIDQGMLQMQGASEVFGGTVSGAGTLALNGATDSFAKGLKLTVGNLWLENGVLTVASKLTYGGTYEQTNGTLTLGKFAVTLNNLASLDSGALRGDGTLSLKSGATIYTYAVEDSSTLLNAGTLTINDYMYDGYNAGDTAAITNSGAKSAIILQNNAYIYATTGSTLTNAGLIDKASGAGVSVIQASLSNTGTLESSIGTLRLSGTSNALSGTILGAGLFELNAGTDAFSSGLSLKVANVLLDGATVNLGGALTYGGSLMQTAGTLGLGTSVLTLTGPFNLTGGVINGTGTLTSAGTMTVNGGALEGAAILKNNGTLVQSGYWYVGYNASDTAQLQNLAGATWRIQNASTTYGDSGAAVTNAGTILKTGSGDAVIDPNFTTTGTVTIAAGALSISGTSNVLGGVFNGGGSLILNAGNDTISVGASLGMGALNITGAKVTLAGAATYAGQFGETSGTLTLGGSALTLSGAETFSNSIANGSGTLALSGQTDMGSGFAAEGSIVMANTGTMTSTGYWYLGYNSTDTAALQNKASGTMILGANEIYAQAGDSLVNAGTIIKSLGGNGAGTIQAAVTNTGSISVTEGTLSFLGAVSGSGMITAGTGAELLFGGTASGGTISLGAMSELALNATVGFADTISGFAAGDVIDLNGMSYSSTGSFTFNTAHDTLAVTNGSTSVTLQLAGSYSASSFALFNDNGVMGITHT